MVRKRMGSTTARQGSGGAFVNIRIDRNSSLPLYVQIKNAIREMIAADLLPPGQKLPPERKLAESLGVNRTTV